MKPKTRTVSVKAWGWYDPSNNQLYWTMAGSRDYARRNAVDGEVVVRLTITAEVPLSPKGGRR
jgi:hypothetical protein